MHKIVKLFHGSNVVPDVLEAGKFYHDFLGSWVYEAQFLEFEGSRNGANLMGGTFSLETLAPVDPNGDAPSARFLKRHGAHFINIAFWVEDIRGLAQHLLDNGVRVALPGGAQVKELPDEDFRFFVPHPKDAHGTLFEFIGEDPNFHDPRRRSWWDASYWSDRHPLGVEGLSHSTVAVADLDGASRFYEDLLGCTLVHEERYEEKGTLSRYYAIADSIIELAHPVDTVVRHRQAHGGARPHRLRLHLQGARPRLRQGARRAPRPHHPRPRRPHLRARPGAGLRRRLRLHRPRAPRPPRARLAGGVIKSEDSRE